jgi:nicotinate-nucleotide adenylyltransferase
MRIGLLGGSFNPAHAGHLHISVTALKRLRLDRVWWLVTPGNPLKDKAGLAPLDQRVALAGATACHPRIEVTAFEAALPGPYSIDTMRFLTRRFPGARFVWIMGGDNLAQFHRWRRWPELFRAMPILVLDRPDARHGALASPAAKRFARSRVAESLVSRLPLLCPPSWAYLTLPLCGLSSTAIRAGGL